MDNSATVQPLAVGVRDAAAMLGVSLHTIRAWHYRGLLRGIKLGSRLVIPYDELERIVNEGLSNPERAA